MKDFDRLAASIETLGPILELDRRWYSNEAGTAWEAKMLWAAIRDVLDRPRCAYDDAALTLWRRLTPAYRARIGDTERRLIRPYCVRSPWLALEERSDERLRSGLCFLALLLPDREDYRDVMVSLAPHRVVADEIGVAAPAIFSEAAGFAGPGVADTIRGFGQRETSLGAFGCKRVETGHGVRFHQF